MYTSAGIVPLDQWTQVGLVVDMTTVSVTIYVNKTKIKRVDVFALIDGWLSLLPEFYKENGFVLFADKNGIANYSLSRVQFWNDSLPASKLIEMMEILPGLGYFRGRF